MSNALCGESISSKRGLLAATWSVVSLLSACSFLAAFVYALTSKNEADNYNNGYNGAEGEGNDAELALTSRALAFSVLWTAVLAALMSVFGTVVLGFQSPLSGQYYLCCDRSVHRTTPLGLGSFIGALLMLANLTLICSVLFGEFEIRDYRENDDRGGEEGGENRQPVDRSSTAFSILCMFLTVIYAGFAALTYAYSGSVIEEHAWDEREDRLLSARDKGVGHFNGFHSGYIGERFDVGRSRNEPTGFAVAQATLA